MKYIASYMLAVLGGNKSPTAADCKVILASVGVEADDARLNKLISELEGKDLDELLANGTAKLAKFGSSGAPAAGGASGDAGAAVEEKVEEKVEEEEEADMGGGMDMFGGGDDY